jgi:7,8-dihydro-6-hydroxymethylpterin-pyrophosphokinase
MNVDSSHVSFAYLGIGSNEGRRTKDLGQTNNNSAIPLLSLDVVEKIISGATRLRRSSSVFAAKPRASDDNKKAYNLRVTAARTDVSVAHAKAVGAALNKSIKFCFSQQDYVLASARGY